MRLQHLRRKRIGMRQQIPATLQSINEDTGVWHFIEQGGVPRSGKCVKGPQPSVGTSGGIAPVGSNACVRGFRHLTADLYRAQAATSDCLGMPIRLSS